jgi:adenylate cyclase
MLNCWLMARGIVPANGAGTVSPSQRTQERTPVKNALDSLPAGRKTELFGWLTEEGRFAPDIGRLLEVLCEKLTALGVPIARATAHVRTLHPEFRGATRIWRRGESIEIRTTRHGVQKPGSAQCEA